MEFRFSRIVKMASGIRVNGYVTQWAARNGSALALDLLAILVVVAAMLMLAA